MLKKSSVNLFDLSKFVIVAKEKSSFARAMLKMLRMYYIKKKDFFTIGYV